MIFLPVLFYLIFANLTPVSDGSDNHANCDANQTYVSCTFKCPEVMCPKADNTILECKPPSGCRGGCGCKPDYRYDATGKCILATDCPQIACSSNQTWASCSFNCPDKYCPEIDQPQPVCDRPKTCPPGCTCKNNYRLNKSGHCISISDCPPIICNRQNEEYNSCSLACLSERCQDADTPPVECKTSLLNCQPKCVCKRNYYRNHDGLCIPAKRCPSVCKDPNAKWKNCKDPCPGTCQNTKPICSSKACVAGCQCKDGYVLSKPGGECVNIGTCADYANCAANQTFVSCAYKCPQCPNSDQEILCEPPKDCPGGCGCKPRYRYNADGDCILGSDCPSVKCTRPYEAWSSCRHKYDWERCEDRYDPVPLVEDDNPTCNPRCTCIKGYFKNESNKCVPEEECPAKKCKRPNEEFYPCRSEYNWDRCQDVFNAPKVVEHANATCNPRCTCIKGYLKNNATECVPVEECPEYREHFLPRINELY